MSKQICESCKVKVSEDLRHCPLCGKFVAEDEATPVSTENASYPKINNSFMVVEKWIKKVRAILFLFAILAVAINLFFTTNAYWFPYVIVGLFALWKILFYPFKEGNSHVASIPVSGLVVAILLIFIDVYDHYMYGFSLGWGLCFSAPSVLTGTTVLAFILALINRKFEESLTKGIVVLTILELLFLLSKLLWFNHFETWPLFMSLLTSFVSLFLLFVFKKKRLIREFNRSFHI